jgi:hypothetical protein
VGAGPAGERRWFASDDHVGWCSTDQSVVANPTLDAITSKLVVDESIAGRESGRARGKLVV